jgi:hypothetical protein
LFLITEEGHVNQAIGELIAANRLPAEKPVSISKHLDSSGLPMILKPNLQSSALGLRMHTKQQFLQRI